MQVGQEKKLSRTFAELGQELFGWTDFGRHWLESVKELPDAMQEAADTIVRSSYPQHVLLDVDETLQDCTVAFHEYFRKLLVDKYNALLPAEYPDLTTFRAHGGSFYLVTLPKVANNPDILQLVRKHNEDLQYDIQFNTSLPLVHERVVQDVHRLFALHTQPVMCITARPDVVAKATRSSLVSQGFPDLPVLGVPSLERVRGKMYSWKVEHIATFAHLFPHKKFILIDDSVNQMAEFQSYLMRHQQLIPRMRMFLHQGPRTVTEGTPYKSHSWAEIIDILRSEQKGRDPDFDWYTR